MMDINNLSGVVVDCAIIIHKELGPGLLESVYEKVLAYELEERGLQVETQKLISIKYKNIVFQNAYRLDLLVNDRIIIEVKSVKQLDPVYSKQLLTYLRLTDKKLGLLMNFNEVLLKDGIVRIVNNL